MNLRQKGFSLVQVMLTVGAMGGAALLFMKMNQNQVTAVKNVEQRSEIVDAVKEIGGILQDQAMCTAAFVGKDAASEENAAPFLKNMLDREVFKINERLPTGLVINSYTLKHEDPNVAGSTVYVKPGEDNGQTYLIVDFQLNNRSLQKKIKLDVTMKKEDNNTKIVTCRKAAGDMGEYATVDYVDEALAAALGKNCVAVTESSCPAGWTRVGTPLSDNSYIYNCVCDYSFQTDTTHNGVSVNFVCPPPGTSSHPNATRTCTPANSTSIGSHCCKD